MSADLRVVHKALAVCRRWRAHAERAERSLATYKHIAAAGRHGRSRAQLLAPSSIAFLPGGQLVVSEKERLRVLRPFDLKPEHEQGALYEVEVERELARGGGPAGLVSIRNDHASDPAGGITLFVADNANDKVAVENIEDLNAWQEQNLRGWFGSGWYGDRRSSDFLDANLMNPEGLLLHRFEGGAEVYIFVADSGNDRISVWRWPPGDVPGDVYDAESMPVTILSGRRRTTWIPGSGRVPGGAIMRHPCGLATHNNTLFVACSGSDNVLCWELLKPQPQTSAVGCAGRWLRTIGGKGTAPGLFRKPTDVLVARGRLLVSEYTTKRIQILSLEGVPQQVLRIPCPRPSPPLGLTLEEKSGRVYVTAGGPEAPIHVFGVE